MYTQLPAVAPVAGDSLPASDRSSVTAASSGKEPSAVKQQQELLNTNTTETNLDKKNRLTRLHRLAAIGALSTLALTGCAVDDVEATPSPSETTQTQVEDEPTPTPTATEAAQEISAELLAKYESYAAMPATEFMQLPRTERVEYLFYLEGYEDPSGIQQTFGDWVSDYARGSADARDKYPASVSSENTPEEIFLVTLSNLRYVAYGIDPELRENAVIASLGDNMTVGKINMMYGEWFNVRAQRYDTSTRGYTAAHNNDSGFGQGGLTYEVLETGTYSDAAYVDMKVTGDATGSAASYRCYYVEALNPHTGEKDGTWVIEEL